MFLILDPEIQEKKLIKVINSWNCIKKTNYDIQYFNDYLKNLNSNNNKYYFYDISYSGIYRALRKLMQKYCIYYKHSIMHKIIHFFFSENHDNKDAIKDMLNGRSLVKNHMLRGVEVSTSSFLPLIFLNEIVRKYIYFNRCNGFMIDDFNYDNPCCSGLFKFKNKVHIHAKVVPTSVDNDAEAVPTSVNNDAEVVPTSVDNAEVVPTSVDNDGINEESLNNVSDIVENSSNKMSILNILIFKIIMSILFFFMK